MNAPNPYEPASDCEPAPSRRGARFRSLVICTAGLAIAAFSIAMLVGYEAFTLSLRQGIGTEIRKGFVVASAFLTLGLGWAVPSLLFWYRRNRLGAMLTILAIVFSVLLGGVL